MVFDHHGPWAIPVVSRGSACLPLALVPGRHSLANAFPVSKRGHPDPGYGGGWLMPMMGRKWLPQEMRKLETQREPLEGNHFSPTGILSLSSS